MPRSGSVDKDGLALGELNGAAVRPGDQAVALHPASIAHAHDLHLPERNQFAAPGNHHPAIIHGGRVFGAYAGAV